MNSLSSKIDPPNEDDDLNKKTAEERVARVAVDNSEIFKRAALKAAKEAAVSKKIANRAMTNAHAF